MSLDSAPLYTDVADGPDGNAYWATAEDGVRIRVGVWGGGTKGTVLLFPGRTEYIEKYGRAARDFLENGYSTIAIDWRGQGLADRLQDNPNIGHIGAFTDYQKDLRAALALLSEIDLPEPMHLLGHSMGGCIGLRSLMEGLTVKSAAFTAPMWGISLTKPKRTAAWIVSTIADKVGMDKGLAPGTFEKTYVLANPFTDNMLTNDPSMFDYMKDQVNAHPELAIGGPSMAWLGEGLRECRSLRLRPTPQTPTLTFLGTDERIVDVEAISDRMARWPNGTLRMVQDAEHEVLMEIEMTRKCAVLKIVDHFNAHQ